MPDCDSCPYAAQIARLEKELDDVRQTKSDAHEKIYGRISELERKMEGSATERAYIAQQLKDIKSDLKDLRDMIEERQKLPEKRWDVAVAAVISGTITLILAWLSGKLSGGV